MNTNYIKEFDSKILLPTYIKYASNYDWFTRSELNSIFNRNKNKNKLKLPLNLRKGFRGYDIFLIKESIDSDDSINLNKCIQELLNGLENSKVYSLLFSIVNPENLTTVSLLPSSILVLKDSPVELLTKILLRHLILIESKYDVSSSYTLVVQGRIWLSKEELISDLKSKRSKNDSPESGLEKKKEDLNEVNRKFASISNLVSEDLNSLLTEEKKWEGVFLNNNFKNLRKKSIEIKLTPYIIDHLKVIGGDYSYSLYQYKEKSKLNNININLLCLHHFDKNIYHLMEGTFIINTWIDYFRGENEILRIFGKNKVIFSHSPVPPARDLSSVVKGKFKGAKVESYVEGKGRGKNNPENSFSLLKNIKEIELGYNFNPFIQVPKSPLLDLKIGTIDVETFKYDELGNQKVFSGGWDVKTYQKLYYLDGYENRDSKNLLKNLFLDILHSDYYNYTFFVHNLSNFDYIFFLDALTQGNLESELFKLKPIIKDDNTLVSLDISKLIEVEKTVKHKNKIKIKKIKQKRTITIFDSALLLPNNLRKLAVDFNCSVEKGVFPYKFVNKENLLYKGVTPDFNYFTDLSFKDYNKLYPNGYLFDLKSECLNYLSKDLTTLREILEKFGQMVYSNFGINITSCKTISGLSLKIFLSNYYKLDYNIREIKGSIEKEIRKAYYGGLVILSQKGKFFSKDKLGYYYDYNSFYPSVMLNPMPVGNPKLSFSQNLESYFGFCYAKIIPPANLDNYLIPFRDSSGKVYCPSTPFFGIYFSELLKASRDYGYKIQVIGGFKFEKSSCLFNSFVKDIFEKRIEAKNNGLISLQYIFKLILNSLYGRFGMKNVENKLEVLEKDKAEKLLRNKNISFYQDIHDKCIIKYNTNINPKIIKLIQKKISQEQDEELEKLDILANLFRQRGVSSSIPIAAAITSYAQIELMKFKNMKSNRLLYSDTDSLILENPLDPKFLSPTELGKLKLEHIICEAYFISPKFYGFKNVKGETVIKTKGINKGKVTFEDLVKLTQGESISLKNTVFLKNFNEWTVTIKDQDYLIKAV
uniref:DNA polymerase n=1 Tax=Termitomyces sp. T123 TaxID=2846913 RepID=A0A8F1D640_9AGAR|nr:DNA polymerase [Termitomyces sp. T123]